MKISKKEKYIILEDDKESLTEFSSYLTRNHKKFKEENVVVDILKYGDLKLEELLGFLEISNRHRAEKKSFVIANDAINIDKIPDELVVAPTLREAEDIIQMDEIERELGF